MTTNSRINELSIGAAVKAFNAVTGDGLMDSEERGRMFMTILEMVRSQQEPRIDVIAPNANDGVVYSDSEYTLEDVLGDAVLSDYTRWVAVDKDGEVWEYEDHPSSDQYGWFSDIGSDDRINKVAPPSNFKNCIWEIKK